MQALPLTNPDVRSFTELRAVFADPECSCKGQAYEMFRAVAKDEEDREWLSANHIRYDVTRIPARIICGEWIKTKGHYHPLSPDGVSYPEIYEVLEGDALYLLQKQDLSDLILVKAHSGDLVLIPPGYGHVTVNPSDKTLLMANLVSSSFTSDYLPFEKLRGAAYYLFSDGLIGKNTHYPDRIPEIRIIEATGKTLPKPFPQSDLYGCVGDEKLLRFLNRPGEFLREFSHLYLFT
ncbi:MAG: glucose-6-phosphate isomerase [Methanospirillum sp.]|nr:glucose-6-phosphate isomerase [Methanospirillum sp.]